MNPWVLVIALLLVCAALAVALIRAIGDADFWRAEAARRGTCGGYKPAASPSSTKPNQTKLPGGTGAVPPPAGACGVRGCPNPRPHSHVMDLARRLREKP